MIYVRSGTKTYRREARRKVRNVLGPSSDPAPGLDKALQAAQSLDQMVSDASNGRFAVVVHDKATGFTSPYEAIQTVRREGAGEV